MVVIIFLPETVLHLLFQFLQDFVLHDIEDLVGRIVKIQTVSLLTQRLFDTLCRSDGRLSDPLIQTVPEQLIKLDA